MVGDASPQDFTRSLINLKQLHYLAKPFVLASPLIRRLVHHLRTLRKLVLVKQEHSSSLSRPLQITSGGVLVFHLHSTILRQKIS